MLDTIRAYLEQHHLLPRQGTIVVAVSGGADSLCLLHLLHQLCGPGKRYPALQLHVAHLNHQLRGQESERDAAVVAQLARSWDLPVTIGSIDVATLARQEHRSLEEAARVARYRFLREVAQGQLIAVAHHQDDQVETLLLHWLRGGGLASMVALQPRQQDIIRPLLCVTHADILAYCEQYHLLPLEDASNSDLRFLRNRIRHELLPLLTELNPGIRETLLRNAEIMQVDFAWIEDQIDRYWPQIVSSEQDDCIGLRLPVLRKLPPSLQRHLLRRATARLHAGQSALELRHYHLIEQLIHRESSGATLTLHLPNHLHVRRTGDTLEFQLVQEESGRTKALTEPVEVQLPIPGRVAIAGTPWIAMAEMLPDKLLQQVRMALQCQDWAAVWQVLPSMRYTVYVDADQLNGGQEHRSLPVLHVRTRRDGDRMRPLGMAYEKKVQDVLVDKYIPRAQRDQIPLFFAAKHCVWLAGIHLDDRVRLTKETRNIVRLSIFQENHKQG
ncbi:MAG TPA: tRNA lysidine(34) synthetase TilS [Ktedonobacteraceae bacterium]